MRRTLASVVAGLLLLVGGCMVIAVKDDEKKGQVIEVNGQKYVIDEEGKAHKIVD